MAKKLVHLTSQVEGLKSRVKAEVTEQYKKLQRPALFQGQTKTYESYTESGGTQPPETTKVQLRVRDVIADIVEIESEMLDRVFQQDLGNTQAKADIVVGERVLKKDVPITHLMYLRKRMEEMRTAFSAVPTPDPSVSWIYDPNLGLLRSETEVVTKKTAKQPYKFEKSVATDRFPAQVEILYRDEEIGEWKRREFSGAERADVKEECLKRLNALIDAIKQAIESANMSVTVTDDTIASVMFTYVTEPINRAYGG